MNIYSGIDADQNFKHWIIETLQNVYLQNSLDEAKPRPLNGGSQSIFILNEDIDTVKPDLSITNVFGDEIINNLRDGKLKCGDEFVIAGIKRAEGEGGTKYRKYFSNLEKDHDYIWNLRHLIKFISLCLSGQLSPTDGFYDNRINYVKVNYARKNTRTVEEIRVIIIECLISYLESNGLEYSSKLQDYTDPKFNG